MFREKIRLFTPMSGAQKRHLKKYSKERKKNRIKEMRSVFPRIHVSPRFQHTKYVCVSSPCVCLYLYFYVLNIIKENSITHFAFNLLHSCVMCLCIVHMVGISICLFFSLFSSSALQFVLSLLGILCSSKL